MGFKKDLLDTVTASGWWKVQRVDEQGPEFKKEEKQRLQQASKSNKPDAEEVKKAENEPIKSNDGTLTGIFRNLDLFK